MCRSAQRELHRGKTPIGATFILEQNPFSGCSSSIPRGFRLLGRSSSLLAQLLDREHSRSAKPTAVDELESSSATRDKELVGASFGESAGQVQGKKNYSDI
ncbi:PPC domain-containing protein [Psidium guajava]|nr:PPC domain-containing protein [Psidium guajava]